MSDQDQGPSLELPSLGFRRRKKAKPEAAEPDSTPDVAAAPADDAPTEVIEPPAPVAEPEPVAESEPESEPEAAPEPEPAAESPTEVLAPVVEEAAAPQAAASDTAPEPAAASLTTVAEPAPAPAKQPKERKPRRARTRWLGAGGIGLVSGIALVGLIGVTLQACDAARGTTSCGGTGLFVLLIILALITVGATRLLRLWGFTDGGTVAFLGIALTGIVVLVFLTTHLQSLTMVLVIPLITMLSFLVSDWVSATMSQANED